MAKRERSDAQKRAEAAYDEARVQISIRLTLAEAAYIDKRRGAESRAAWIREKVLGKATPSGRGVA